MLPMLTTIADEHSKSLAVKMRFVRSLTATLIATRKSGHGAHSVHSALTYISLTILIIFAVELFGLLAAMGAQFFRNLLYTLDINVVTVAIVVDLIVLSKGEDDGASVGVVELVIVARCWRFVRIVHGLYASVHETDLKELEKIIEDRNDLKENIKNLEEKMKDIDWALHGGGVCKDVAEGTMANESARSCNVEIDVG